MQPEMTTVQCAPRQWGAAPSRTTARSRTARGAGLLTAAILGIAAFAGPAGATVTDIPFVTVITCAGERLELPGRTNSTARTVLDADGNEVDIATRGWITASGVSADGTRYTFRFSWRTSSTPPGTKGNTVRTDVRHTRLTAHGDAVPNDDLVSSSRYHIVIRPDGTVATLIDRADSDCR